MNAENILESAANKNLGFCCVDIDKDYHSLVTRMVSGLKVSCGVADAEFLSRVYDFQRPSLKYVANINTRNMSGSDDPGFVKKLFEIVVSVSKEIEKRNVLGRHLICIQRKRELFDIEILVSVLPEKASAK